MIRLILLSGGLRRDKLDDCSSIFCLEIEVKIKVKVEVKVETCYRLTNNKVCKII